MNLPLQSKEKKKRGGLRARAGRKPTGRGGVWHRVRAPHKARFPVHVTLRAVWKVGNLRAKQPFVVIRDAIRAAAHARDDFRVVHFSVQGNHLHLIVEAEDESVLGRGMQGLAIRIARRLNRLLHRKGPVFADRYHRHDLKNPRETRNGIAYVLQNFRKHAAQRGERCARGWIDPCSSSPWFRFWTRTPATAARDDARSPVSKPETWLLQIGWTRWGWISPEEIPGYAD